MAGFQWGISAALRLTIHKEEEFEVPVIGSWECDYQFRAN